MGYAAPMGSQSVGLMLRIPRSLAAGAWIQGTRRSGSNSECSGTPSEATRDRALDQSSDASVTCEAVTALVGLCHRCESDASARVIPSHVSTRIAVQSGLFTIHPKPTEAFDSSTLTKFVIPQKTRRDIKKGLSKLGVDTGSMCPDIDGIARHIDWLRTDEY